MARMRVLIAGELERLRKYRLLTANFVVLLIWVLVALALGESQIKLFIPFIFLMDSAMTIIALAAVTIFYERQEHTLNSILVSPVTENEYLFSKVIVGVLNSVFTVVFIGIAMWLVKGITFNYLVLIPAVTVTAVFHTLLGIVLTYSTRDFTGIMLRAVLYMFVFLLPAVFGLFGIVSEEIMRLLIIFPAESAARLISASITAVDGWKIVFGYVYLIVLSFILYVGIVRPGFNRHLAREIGV